MDRRKFITNSGMSVLGGIAVPWSTADALRTTGVPEDGKVTTQRLRSSFDDDWRFHLGDVQGGESPAFNDASWESLKLPHDWSIEGSFDESNPSGPSGAYLRCGVGWYRKTFRLPTDLSSRHLEVMFDGVYMDSDVWLNGHHLGKRPYGYISFAYDLTLYLKYGHDENLLAVRVNNSMQPNCRWYSGSGIYRNVWVDVTHPIRVDTWGTFVRTPSVSKEKSDAEISTSVVNGTDEDRTIQLVTEIQDASGKVVGLSRGEHNIPARQTYAFEQRIMVVNPDLWSVDHPTLYTAVSRVYADYALVDEYRTLFGFRYFSFDADTGFSLNGERMKLKGVCMHHDHGTLGTAFNFRAAEHRLRILKEMGCNALRMSHNPPSPQLLDLCDSMGFLVMDEFVDEWRVGKKIIEYGYHIYFDQWAKKDLTSMILRDRNHPSIILWSLGNEIPDTDKPETVETAKMLVGIVRDLDKTRPTTCAIVNIKQANKSGFPDVFDVVGYNGGGGSDYYFDVDHKRYPKRKIFGSEAPHTVQTRGVYVSDENYCSSYDTCFLRMSSEGNWKMIQMRPFVAGGFRWTGPDYLGEPTPHKRFHTPYRKTAWPARSCDFGVIDTCDFTKDTYYFYQSKWTDKPMLHLLPHWNWPRVDGLPVFVWCYTNCDSVELHLNGRSLGVQHPVSTAGSHLCWEVPYIPGELEAVGRRGEVVVCRQKVVTAGTAAKLLLDCDRNVVRADGHDLAYISVSVVDEKGIVVPGSSQLVHFDVQGEGRLVGVDNGDPLSHQKFKNDKITAFQGKCLAIVQSTRKAGQIIIRARVDGFETEQVVFHSMATSSADVLV